MYDHEQRYFLKHKRGYFSKGSAKEHMDSLAQNAHAILLAYGGGLAEGLPIY